VTSGREGPGPYHTRRAGNHPWTARPGRYHPARVHYHIDGYNLAHWLADDDDLQPHALRALLIGALRPRLPRDAESVHIYWDVRRPSPAIPANEYLDWCTMHNVPDADAAIIDAVADSHEPRRLVVVSRDREVTGKSRQLGARILSPSELLGPRGRPR
jgi:hypothetical protein